MKQIWNIIKYSIVFLINLLILLFLHSYFNLVILIVMLAVPFISIILSAIALHSTRIRLIQNESELIVNEPFLFEVEVANKSPIPLLEATIDLDFSNTFLGISGSHELSVPAIPIKPNTIKYQLSSENIGNFSVHATRLYARDWFGFVRFSTNLDLTRDYYILPAKTMDIAPDLTAVSEGMTESSESHTGGNDFSEVHDIREYQPGDKLQNIHWKLSAKKDVFMVKERENMSSSELIVLVELYQNDTMILDDIITACYATAGYLLNNRIPFTLVYYSQARGELIDTYISGLEELNNWLQALFYEKSYEEPRLALDMYRKIIDSDRSFVVITYSDRDESGSLFKTESSVQGFLCN